MRPLRILVVDDHADSCTFLARLLAADGYAVRTAGSVSDGLIVAAAADGDGWPGGCDVVIADVGLPDGRGTGLIGALRKRYGTAGVVLTGYGDDDTKDECERAGCAAILVKPVTYEAVRAAVEAAGAESGAGAG